MKTGSYAKAPGRVITFYSFKGGVGRSFALANVAAVLSRWGYRVLCIDWDIEAPGLTDYFRPWLLKKRQRGLVDLIAAFAKHENTNWRDYAISLHLPASTVPLTFITAGSDDGRYASRLYDLNWKLLYEKHKLGEFIEGLRTAWKEEFDFILIDSRTGITDVGGICTVHLPDVLVFFFTANNQSLSGSVQVIRNVIEARKDLPLNRGGLLVLPVPSRFDTRVEYRISRHWMKIFARQLKQFYENWLEEEVTISSILEFTRIPYLSYWTFGEKVPVLEERLTDPETISYHLATLAALLAMGLGETSQLVRGRETYLARARGNAPALNAAERSLIFDLYLSYPADRVTLAREIARLLRDRGLHVFLDADQVLGGDDFRAALELTLSACHSMLVLSHAPLGMWQQAEMEQFRTVSVANPDRKRILVQIGRKGTTKKAKWFLIQVNERPDTDLAQEIAAQVGNIVTPASARELPVDATLRSMAQGYMRIRHNEYSERVRAKNTAADALGDYVIRKTISRDQLARERGEGLLMALAAAVSKQPRVGDLPRILRASTKVRRLHVRYRIVLAISKMLRETEVNREQKRMVSRILTSYKTGADRPLRTLIGSTQKLLWAEE